MQEYTLDMSSLKEYTVQDWKDGHPACLPPSLTPVKVYRLTYDEFNADFVPYVKTSAHDCVKLSLLRTVPLDWVEGRAVYRGSTLYVKDDATVRPVEVFDKKGEHLLRVTYKLNGLVSNSTVYTTNMTWVKPENKEPIMQPSKLYPRDLSSLRPYEHTDLLNSLPVCLSDGSNVKITGCTSIDVSPPLVSYSIQSERDTGDISTVSMQQLFKRPLFWLEGKAVYQGCTLYLKTNHFGEAGEEVKVIDKRDDSTLTIRYSVGKYNVVNHANIDCLSWTKPQEYKIHNPPIAAMSVDDTVRKDILTRIESLEKELSLFRSMLSILDCTKKVADVKNNQPT